MPHDGVPPTTICTLLAERRPANSLIDLAVDIAVLYFIHYQVCDLATDLTESHLSIWGQVHREHSHDWRLLELRNQWSYHPEAALEISCQDV